MAVNNKLIEVTEEPISQLYSFEEQPKSKTKNFTKFEDLYVGLYEIEDLFLTFGISSSRDQVIKLIYEVVYNQRKTVSQESRIISDFSGEKIYNF